VFKTVLVSTSLVLLGLEIIAIRSDSHYRYDIVMCWLLLAAACRWRDWLGLTWLSYFLLAGFLLLHALGVFGLYETYPLGIEFDYWVHASFGMVAAIIIHRFFSLRMPEWLPRWNNLLAILVVMGFAALHELYEFAGALLLGEGEGVLFIGAGDLDPWDTQKDIFNNLLGVLAGLLVAPWFSRRE
jgi:putative membrane protein